MNLSDNDLFEKVCMPIYRELFKKATPSCDIDKVIAGKKEVTQDNWYMKYYLDEDSQQEIINRHCKEANLSEIQRRKVYNAIVLGFSPRSSKPIEQQFQTKVDN